MLSLTWSPHIERKWFVEIKRSPRTRPNKKPHRQRHLGQHHRRPRLQRPRPVHLPHRWRGDAAGPHQPRGLAADRRRPAPAHHRRQLPGNVHSGLRRLLREQHVHRFLLQRLLRCHPVPPLEHWYHHLGVISESEIYSGWWLLKTTRLWCLVEERGFGTPLIAL